MAAADYTSLVQALYVSYFGRPADFFGLQNFAAALEAAGAPTNVSGLESSYYTNSVIKALVDSFGSSSESTSLYGGSTTQLVIGIYNNLFGRSPDPSGLIFWSNAINNGILSKSNAALAIMAGGISNPEGTDAATINNKIAIATQFTNLLDTSSEIIGYSGATASAQARSLLSTVTASTVPDNVALDNTVLEIVNFEGLNTPKPVAVTSVVDNYNTANQVNIGTNFTVAPIKQGAVPGYFADVLSYAINSQGEISFSGTFANSLTPQDKAGDILAILQNMPGTACTFVQFNNQTQMNDTYVVCTGTGTSGPTVIDIVGQRLHGMDSINIVEPVHWSS